MSAKNYHITNPNPEVLKTLKSEYDSMGRDTKIEGNTLTVYALRQKPTPPAKKKFSRGPKPSRD